MAIVKGPTDISNAATRTVDAPAIVGTSRDETPPLTARIGAALAAWGRRRGDFSDTSLDEFCDLLGEVADPMVLDTALVRIAHQTAGPGVRSVELYREDNRGTHRVAAWPPRPEAHEGASGPSATVEVPVRCAGQERGVLRVTLDAGRTIGPERQRRLATLAVLAAASAWVPANAATPIDAPNPAGHELTTGLPDAAFLASFLRYALAMAERRREPISLLYIAVDRLAAIRDLLGPQVASEALRSVGRTIAATLRSSDLIAQLGDGRLVAVLPGAAVEGAMTVAETLRSTIEAIGAATLTMPVLTASIGVATCPDHAATPSALRSAAATALAEARLGGRNRVALAPVGPSPTPLRIAQAVG